MAADATAALYAAVGAALLADATLTGLVGDRVFAGWDEGGDVFPFVRVHVPRVDDYEDDCGEGSRAVVQVHAFAKGGPANVAAVAANVRRVLDNASLALTGADLWWIDYTDTLNSASPDDPGVYAAVVRFSAVTTTQ